MIEENVIQRQGRIRRQMLEQQLAVPFDHHSQSLINGLSESLLKSIDRKMLETNPIIKINCEDDKIKIEPVDLNKFYLKSGIFSGEKYGKDVARSIVEGVAAKVNEPELTLVNGVYE